MYRSMLAGGVVAAALLAGPAIGANGEDFHAVFSGFNEVGALNSETGAILSEGRGTLDLKLNRSAQTLMFTLQFSNLSAPVTQSHIHFGKVHMAGGVIVFFCSNLGNGPAGTQACPANGGSVSGTLTAASVVGPAAQHMSAGDFDALADALESDTAYANIHTTSFPAGEIRGQIRRDDRVDE